MIVVCAIDRPRSTIISTRSRRLSLKRRYQRTHRMTTSRSKWRPLNSSSTVFSLAIADLGSSACQRSRSDRAVCTRALETAMLYSVEVAVSWYCGGAHPDSSATALTFDLRTGASYDLNKVFHVGVGRIDPAAVPI